MADVKAKRSHCQRFLSILRLTKEGATPVKWPIVITVTIALFANAFILMFPFAFLPFMVLHFGYREEEKGYYVGLIASSYFLGRIMGSFFWGWLSDKKGRRPVMLINIGFNILLCPAFGFSTNLWMACLFRLLIGTMTGVLTCTKTILYETSDNTNQAFAMSCIGMSWGLGIILGPAVGGFLSSPSTKYPDVFPQEGFFVQFPFVLPCLIGCFINILSFVLVFFKLPETLHKKELSSAENKDDTLLEKRYTGDGDLTRISSEMLKEERKNAMQSLDDIAMLFSAQDIEDTTLYRMKSEAYMHYLSHRHINVAKNVANSGENIADTRNSQGRALGPMKRKMSLSAPDLGFLSRQQQREGSPPKEAENLLTDKITDDVRVDVGADSDSDEERMNCFRRLWRATKRSILGHLLRSSDVRVCLFAYSLFSFCVIGYEEVLGVWVSTDVRFDGLGFSTNQLGLMAMVVSVPVLILQLFLFSKLEARFGVKKMILGFSFLLVITASLVPMLHLIYDRSTLLWLCIFLILSPMRIAFMCVFTGLGIFINNSVNPAMAGSLNGLALTVSAISRTIAPVFGGSVFAWSITSGLPYPFDVNCVFVAFGICYAITHIVILFTPERLNLQSKRHAVVEETTSKSNLSYNDDNFNESKDKNCAIDSEKQELEKNANEKDLEWYLKEGQTVAIVERNVPEKNGKDKSTAF